MGSSQDEKKVAGASYIYSFYGIVQQLTTDYANYLNLMLEIQFKYGDETPVDKMPENERLMLIQLMHNIRFSVHKSYVQFVSMSELLKIKEFKVLTETYTKIKTQLIINREDLDKFVIEMNKILLNDIIKTLLETTQDIVDKLYSQND